jgi:protease IV
MNITVPSRTWSTGSLLLYIGIPLLIGGLLSLLIPAPVIGVIHLDDAIYSKTAGELITQLIYARDNPNIKAVVLVINSPGGTVSDTEAIYGEW